MPTLVCWTGDALLSADMNLHHIQRGPELDVLSVDFAQAIEIELGIMLWWFTW